MKNNCSLKDADIAFFPIYKKIPIPLKPNSLGVITVPPKVVHRIRLHSEAGIDVSLCNKPLDLLVLDPLNSSKEEFDDFINSLMFNHQKNGFRTIWVFSSKEFCDYVQEQCGDDRYYFHCHIQPDEHCYGLIKKADDSPEVYLIEHECLGCLN